MAAAFDSLVCGELAECVEKLTTCGEGNADDGALKKIKRICRSSDDYIRHAYYLLNHQLQKEHAEVRLGALRLCDQLFQRSHHFRELLVSDFQTFLELTVETDPEQPLPPPVAASKKLRRFALDIINDWYTRFGTGYKKLALGYDFLRECKKVDFADVRGVAERRRDEEETRRKDVAAKEILERYSQEVSEMMPEIDSCLHQMQECFRLLMPESLQAFSSDDFDAATQPSCSTDRSDGDEWLRHHGLVNADYNLTVEIDTNSLKLRATEDNAVILESLKDLRTTVASRCLPAVARWIRVMAKGPATSAQLKKAIDLKSTLEVALKKCDQLGVDDQAIEVPSDDDDDDQFVEVEPKEGYEATVAVSPRDPEPKKELADKCVLGKKRDLEELEDPASMAANVKRLQDKMISSNLDVQPSTSSSSNISSAVDERKIKLLAAAPKLRFDADLYNWGEEASEDPSLIIKRDSLHSFWSSGNQETTEFRKKENEALRHNRVMEFSGDFQPVKWQCRAPLPSGRLCPRRDRTKCPFHGKIIARDETGNPVDPKERERLREEEEKRQQENPDWQDPVLLQEIRSATGIDLTVKKKRGQKQVGMSKNKRKYPGLTDLTAAASTSRSRLEKVVLNRGSVKRVAAAMDAIDYKKHMDKFASQFNYSCVD